uniref:Zorya protein ZorC EH domain-containing protein n=1 Tax=Geobacter sp. (strain M21) TaxID=443144 RepID=C6E2C6_GEOSM
MIQLLRDRITATVAISFQQGSLGSTDHMSKTLAAVRRNFDNLGGPPVQGRTIADAVSSFRATGKLLSFSNAKYVCIGVSHELPDGWRLIEDEGIFSTLIDEVRLTALRPRLFLRCYQGLLYNYFNVYTKSSSESCAGNWLALNNFLKTDLKQVQQTAIPPTWLKMLTANENLLEDNPCRKYGNILAEGGQKEFRGICEAVGILSGSWLLEEAVFSQVEAICTYDDSPFAEKLDEMLLLLVGQGNVSYSKRLIVRCLAALAIRYSRCREHPDHSILRDTLIKHIGNPWLDKTAWDVSVNDEPARIMVDSWLKRHLIHAFFTLLSEDGATDQRRLDYWLRYYERINDLWFVLGRDARKNSSSDFVKIRALARDHLLYLDGGGASNNAFIMKIGDKYAVEFGLTGNACYIFNEDRLPFDPTRMQRTYNVTDLKSKSHGKQMIHSDGHQRWESIFDDYLSPRIGWRPGTPVQQPSHTRAHASYDRLSNQHVQPPKVNGPLSAEGYREVWQMAADRFYGMTDKRSSGGGLWVDAPNNIAFVSSILTKHGFNFRQDKGWYRE